MALGTGNSVDHDVARRLTAVLAADVVGYSRLMADDEIGALNQLKSLRGTVIDPLVTHHRGEIVGSAGDSFLIAFASAVDSVSCALAWQRACAEASEALVAGQRMLFRIGIHLGDVIPEGGTIYGDGVNIAARLEKLAQPGGVVVSRAIRDQVEGRLNLAFTDLGRLELKNIPRPVEAFEICRGETIPKSADRTMGSASAKLSIAILPFSNMSGDKEQDYFSDGITEDIITEISRFKELHVIGRNSSFAFRGQNLEIKGIAAKLGVQFIVEGSVRKAGNRIRVTAQLIEFAKDRHVWAERYDRSLDDIFAIQDEIARTIATIVAGHVTKVGATNAKTRPTENLTAYDYMLRARGLYARYGSYQDRADLATRAIELDPDYAMPHAFLANTLMMQSFYDGNLATRERAAGFAKRAIELDPDEPWAHANYGFCLMFLMRVPEAASHFERARQLNPNDGTIMVLHGLWYCYSGQFDKAITSIEDALKRDPFAHEWYWDDLCIVMVGAQRYQEAISAFEKLVTPAPWSYLFAAVAHVNLGNLERARALVASFHQTGIPVTAEDQIRLDPYLDRSIPERMIADLRRAL